MNLWHIRYFVEEPTFDYGGLCEDAIVKLDEDGISTLDLGKLVNSLGYRSYRFL